MEIDLVVFDMAGTTVNDDDSVNRCLRAALEGAGVSRTPAAVNRVMGLPKPDAIAILVKETGFTEPPAETLSAIHRDFVARSIAFYERDPSVHEVAGTASDRLGWSGSRMIDAVICSDEVERGRPHPDMILALMSRLGVANPRRVAKVGDTPADLHEGKSAGCGLIAGVTRGTHTREELEVHPHTHLIETVAELPGVLGLTFSFKARS
jgi:phosphoglycolate phosphatase-like HAD superfamily hydrolase